MCKTKQNLCLDKGYDFQEIKDSVIKKVYLPHTRHKGEQKAVIIILREEDGLLRTNSWHNRLRTLLVRYKKKSILR